MRGEYWCRPSTRWFLFHGWFLFFGGNYDAIISIDNDTIIRSGNTKHSYRLWRFDRRDSLSGLRYSVDCVSDYSKAL